MQIILIGNYPPDRQESMQRFACMLEHGFQRAGYPAKLWLPPAFFGSKAKITNSGAGKWLGYVDKWILFPLLLRLRLFLNASQTDTYFHICDHSNAPYLNHLPINRTSITCHDVLAIRAGLGYEDSHVTASRLGRKLQSFIFKSLKKANKLAAVSQFTLDQLCELTNTQRNGWRVIHNSFNAEFYPMPAAEASTILDQASFNFTVPFLLHVGSSLPRKNRRLLLDMIFLLGDKWQGNICFAGEAVEPELAQHAITLGLQERVVSIVGPSHMVLVALYSTCTAFIFPSYSEGFGWPVIEAQACGAPVIASSVAPMPEVSGGAALHADPSDAQSFAEALLTLQQSSTRASLIQQGFINSRRFEPSHMIRAYLDLCQLTPA